tara:strand:- start:14794 stop:15645 length:852 start_codon:yes stop_codon:yes gene_type:complete
MKLLYPFAKRFIAGYDFESAKNPISKLLKEGYEVSIDYVGEKAETVEDSVKASVEYFKVINDYKDQKIDISIKPTQLGLLIDKELCFSFLDTIVEKAAANGHTIRLDMEDSAVTSHTLDLCLRLNQKYQNVGVAIQANLFRTECDLKSLIKKDVSVRLVKGAYSESEKIAYQTYSDIESSFFNHAANLYSIKANNPAIATHDDDILEDIKDLIPQPKFFDYEFLYGVRRDTQKKMKDEGYKVRIYVPFGENWLPYVMRRLKEWKNLKFVIVNVIKEWSNGIWR